VFRNDPDQRAVELNVELMTPLDMYKRLYENSLQTDLYGKKLVFKFLDQPIRYGQDAFGSQGKDLTTITTVDVYYEEFDDFRE